MKDTPTFGDLSAGIDYYAQHDYSDEFDGLPPDMDVEDVEDDDPETRYEKSLFGVVGDATADEVKAVGLGYVDTDPDPSPNPGATRLRRYWTRGKGALKIRWGTPHDFNRCVRHLRKYVGPGAEGLCNVFHRSALGAPPGKGHGHKSDLVADEETKGLFITDGMMRLENLFLSKKLFDGWEHVVDSSTGDHYDVGYNVLTKAWEAHDAENYLTLIASANTETELYEVLNHGD